MNLDTLTVRGFLRFTDPVTIDLRALPPGLIAITGENGAGKSTILEAGIAALYRQFASRGDLTPYATGKDSYIDATFSVADRGAYRARVNVDGVRRTTDATLEAIGTEGTVRLLNDGKATTFDAAVRQHFPSRDLLLASAFSAQNQEGNFIHRKPAQRRELFGELLGLSALTSMGATAKAVAGVLEQGRLRLATRRDILAADSSPAAVEQLARERAGIEAELAQAIERRARLQAQVTDLEARLALMADDGAAHAAARQQVTRLEQDIRTRQNEKAGAVSERVLLVNDSAKSIARLQSKLTTDLADIDTKLAGNAKIQGMAAEIRAAVTALAAADEAIALHRDQLDAAQRQQWALTEEIQQVEREVARLADVAREQARAERGAQLLTDVPCGGVGPFAACAFLQDAQQAKAKLSEYVAALEPKAALADRLAALVSGRDTVVTVMDGYRADLQRSTQARAAAVKLAEYAPKLEASEARVEELQALRARIERESAEALQAEQQRTEQASVALAEREAVLADRLESLTTALACAERDLAGVSERLVAYTALHTDLTLARRQYDEATGAVGATEARRDGVTRQRDLLETKRAQVSDIAARLARVEQELLDWQLLAKALGKDGLPDLEIDAAGPTISAYTNELLEVCHGPRFSLELVTQVAKADGKGLKDEFTVRVTDNASGGTARDIADLSGGEQVIVSEALRNAIAVYVNQRAPMPVRTCWRDETTGALDPENAQRYIAMLRKVMEMGGVSQLLFITHNPDAAAQADAQIRLEDGRAHVLLPPFTREVAA